jgi:metal-responsive CopG/Arc/MetJ family transcriptional regulator
MNTITRQAITALDAMRLPELQARYLEVLGSETRCPNRSYLIRKISEALSANDTEELGTSSPDEPSHVAACVEDEFAHDEQPAEESEGPEEVDEIDVTLEADAEDDAELGSSPVSAVAAPHGRFRGMTVEELQHKYLEVVGRATNSENKAYLIWKIREAEKGHVPVGPIQGRSASANPVDTRVLPLRMEVPLIDQIDAARRRVGLRSRTEFFRRAVDHYLEFLDAPQNATETSAEATEPSP